MNFIFTDNNTRKDPQEPYFPPLTCLPFVHFVSNHVSDIKFVKLKLPSWFFPLTLFLIFKIPLEAPIFHIQCYLERNFKTPLQIPPKNYQNSKNIPWSPTLLFVQYMNKDEGRSISIHFLWFDSNHFIWGFSSNSTLI